MKHPSISDLALFAGREHSWWAQWKLRRHIDACAQCQHEVALFREAQGDVREEADRMPAAVQWDRLAAEMGANIRLGLEASDAISAYALPAGKPARQGMSWQMAAITAGFVLLLSIGYWLNAVKNGERLAALRGPDPVVVEASERGVGMSDGTKGMELQGPKASQRAAIVTVSTTGAAGAQYIDEETGQITVNQVYVE